MFKEKYLIFREGDEEKQKAAKSEEPKKPEKPEKPELLTRTRQEAGTEAAEKLAMQTADTIMDDIFGKNRELAIHELGPVYEEIYQWIDGNVKAGFKYDGLYLGIDKVDNVNDINDIWIIWKKDGKQYKLSLKNEILDPEIFEALYHLIDEKHLTEISGLQEDFLDIFSERSAWRYIKNNIYPYLHEKRPQLSESKIYESNLIREEILPSLTAGYKIGKPFLFLKEENGFTLKSTHKETPDQHYYLNWYDDKLNYIEDSPPTLAKYYLEKVIWAQLREKFPKLDEHAFMHSYLIHQEVMPLLEAGYEGGNPYKFELTDKGFALKFTGEADKAAQDYHSAEFDLSQYSEYLMKRGVVEEKPRDDLEDKSDSKEPKPPDQFKEDLIKEKEKELTEEEAQVFQEKRLKKESYKIAQKKYPEELEAINDHPEGEDNFNLETGQKYLEEMKTKEPKVKAFVDFVQKYLTWFQGQLEANINNLSYNLIIDIREPMEIEVENYYGELIQEAIKNSDAETITTLGLVRSLFERLKREITSPYFDIIHQKEKAAEAATSSENEKMDETEINAKDL